jgi:hypothetical protein
MVPDTVRRDRRLRRSIGWRAAGIKLLLRAFVRDRPAQRYGAVYRELWTLDAPMADRLSQQCSLHGVSAHAVISLAVALAFRAICGPRRITQCIAPIDMRRFLPTLAEDRLFAVAPTIVLRPGPPDAGEPSVANYWARARALQADVQHKIQHLAPKVYRNFLGMERLHDVFDKMVTYGQSRRAGWQLTVSYVGRLRLAQDYDGFRLRAVRGISALIGPTPAHLVVISRYADTFDFVLASDESSLPRAEALAIRDKTMDMLLALSAPQTHAAAPRDPVESTCPAHAS